LSTVVDPELERLLVEHIASFDKLELLALACRDRVTWTPKAASAQLHLPEGMVEIALAEMGATGLLIREGDGFRFPTTGAPLVVLAERLCKLYDDDRFTVLQILTRAAFKRIRLTAAHTFADAFRFRKGDPDDDPKGGTHG
jgi:hypothetical protein